MASFQPSSNSPLPPSNSRPPWPSLHPLLETKHASTYLLNLLLIENQANEFWQLNFFLEINYKKNPGIFLNTWSSAVKEEVRQVRRGIVTRSSTQTFVFFLHWHLQHLIRNSSIQVHLTQIICQVSPILDGRGVTWAGTMNRGRILAFKWNTMVK